MHFGLRVEGVNDDLAEMIFQTLSPQDKHLEFSQLGRVSSAPSCCFFYHPQYLPTCLSRS